MFDWKDGSTGNGENGSGNPWPTIRIHPPPILSPATMDDIDEEDERMSQIRKISPD